MKGQDVKQDVDVKSGSAGVQDLLANGLAWLDLDWLGDQMIAGCALFQIVLA